MKLPWCCSVTARRLRESPAMKFSMRLGFTLALVSGCSAAEAPSELDAQQAVTPAPAPAALSPNWGPPTLLEPGQYGGGGSAVALDGNGDGWASWTACGTEFPENTGLWVRPFRGGQWGTA